MLTRFMNVVNENVIFVISCNLLAGMHKNPQMISLSSSLFRFTFIYLTLINILCYYFCGHNICT